jgi:sugar diacid utilization regulator
MSELQRIVDALGRATRRNVAVHDTRRRLLAYSSHAGPVDDVRATSILTRQGPARSFAWAASFGIEQAQEPVRLPRNPDLGMEPRVVAPIRFEGRLVGYLWLLDPDESLTDHELEQVAGAAQNCALAMHHESLRDELERGRERELLRDLLSAQQPVRAQAAEELVSSRLILPLDEMVALVLRPVHGREPVPPQEQSARTRMQTALNRARATLPVRQALTLVRPDHGVVVMTVRRSDTRPGGIVQHAATTLHTVAGEALADTQWTPMVGVGDAQHGLADTHLSYRHARQAAEVAALAGGFGPVAAWGDLGVYQTLVDLPIEEASQRLHPGLTRLLATREADIWLRTLEVYLDLACDARAAARQLNIQRGSLYHRLERIQELAAVDLRTGSDRLALHLGLKIARLAGLLTPARSAQN